MISIEKLLKFTQLVLLKAGAQAEDAKNLADILLWADQVGRTEQGVERLPILCKRIQKGLIQPSTNMCWGENSGSVACLDAKDSFGHLATKSAAQKAVTLARINGVGAVTVKNSNYFGAAGYYAWLIAREGMIGLIMSNSFPKVAPYGGSKSVMGTNPMAFSAPRADQEPLLVDMATAAVAGSEIRRRKAKGLALDPGMAVDKQGNPLLDPAQFSEGHALPFGGARGYGIMLMVETLTGVLSGGAIGQEVKSMYNDWSNSGKSTHFVCAINPDKFLPAGDFPMRMKRLCEMIYSAGENVRIPGQTRWDFYKQTKKEGISPENIPVSKLIELGDQYQVDTSCLQGLL